MSGLAFDRNTRTLFAVDRSLDQLWRLDTQTAEATPVGSLGFGQVEGLAFDFKTNTLFGADRTGQLIAIDPSTGAGTAIGPFGFTNGSRTVLGLAFDPSLNILFGTRKVGNNSELVIIDHATGAARSVGSPSRIDRCSGNRRRMSA